MKNKITQHFFRILFALCWLAMPALAFSQPFVVQGVGLPGVELATVDWGDYDADGDLDLLLIGEVSNNVRITKVYRKDGASFTDINANLPGLWLGDGAWGDYDSDGDLDILLAGTMSNNSDITRIYRNDGGTFTDIAAGLPGFDWATVDWGDFDNDGDEDIILAGNSELAWGPDLRIYHNQNGVFVDAQAGLDGMFDGAVAIGDYDADGDLDVFSSGTHVQSQNQYLESQLYRNDAGTFTQVYPWPFQHLQWAAADWGDYDNDGDLDLALAGYPGTGNSVAKIYRNNGGAFTDMGAGLQGLSTGSASWGDFDNDGDADILFTGGSGGPGFRLYRNNMTSFSLVANTGFNGIMTGDASWGDYDNDNDLDVILAGSSYQANVTELFRNGILTDNTAPSIPTGLVATSQGPNSIRFAWNAATDAETPSPGLSYRLWIGTAPNTYNVSAPLADTSTGWRHVAAPGNIKGTTWILKRVQTGTYYAAVSAIDPGFKGSAFSSSTSVTVTVAATADGVQTPRTIMAGPNPTQGQISIHPQFTLKSKGQYTLTNLAGQTLPGFSGIWDGELSLDLSELPAATYLLRLEAKGMESGSAIRIVKQ